MKWILGAFALLVLGAGATIGPEIYKAASEDPTVWESDIAALEQASGEGPSQDAVLFVGSSSIRLWADLAEDMAPLPVIQRGFGGAKIGDVLHYLDRLVLEPEVRAIVMFVGTNDINTIGREGKPPEQVVAAWEEIARRIRAARPQTPFYFLALKPTTTGHASWPTAMEVNRQIRERCERDPLLHFLDVNHAVMLADGSPDPDKLLWDGIHLNRAGYVAWGSAIKARLMADLGK